MKIERARRRALFHDLLLFTMRRPKATVFLTVAVFALALAAWPLVPSQFFPSSDRPELLVNMTLRQGVSIDATIEVAKKFDDLLKSDADIDHWSSYTSDEAQSVSTFRWMSSLRTTFSRRR